MALMLLICLGIPSLASAQFGKPPAFWRGDQQGEQQQQQQGEQQGQQGDLQTDAQVESRQYDAEVKKLARELAVARAEKLSWLYFPAEVNWVGVSIFYGNDWQLREACDVGRSCIPHMGITYGAEVFLNPFASLDLVARVGGSSQFTDGFGTRHGLDVSALARLRIVGIVPILLGWRMVGTPYQQVGADGNSVIDTTVYSHYGYLGAGFRFRGATLEVGVNVGAHSVLSAQSIDEPKNIFSAIATLRLVTPALLGF
jgi:hypothetical protein